MMNYNEQVKLLIESLNKLTLGDKLHWTTVDDYLDTARNNNLKMYIVRNNRYIYTFGNNPVLDEYDSYCANINNGLVYIFSFELKKKKFFVCALQSSVSSEIVPLTDEFKLQTELNELRDKIKNTQESAEKFLESIIRISNEN